MAVTMRKAAGLQITDRITLYYDGDPTLAEVLRVHGDYVLQEVLGQEARPGLPEAGPGVHVKALRLDGRELTVGIAHI